MALYFALGFQVLSGRVLPMWPLHYLYNLMTKHCSIKIRGKKNHPFSIFSKAIVGGKEMGFVFKTAVFCVPWRTLRFCFSPVSIKNVHRKIWWVNLCSLENCFFSSKLDIQGKERDGELLWSRDLKWDRHSVLEGPTGLSWLLADNGWKKVTGASWQRLGFLGVLCVAFLEVTQVHRCESYKIRQNDLLVDFYLFKLILPSWIPV